MRLASDLYVVVGHQRESRHSSISSDSDIDDAATLQARLPSVKAVSEFGELSAYQGEAEVSVDYYQQSYQNCIGEMRKADFAPLNVRRTRDSASMFYISAARAAT